MSILQQPEQHSLWRRWLRTATPKPVIPLMTATIVKVSILLSPNNKIYNKMPYQIIRVTPRGYILTDDKGHIYNKVPKSKKECEAQMRAIEASKARRKH